MALLPVILSIVSAPPVIDRRALVERHRVVVVRADPNSPLQVGSGELAYAMDVTGLQTFTPFNTLSHWGWHSSPPPRGEAAESFQGQVWTTQGRPVRYEMPDPERPGLSLWMAANPHRVNLGRIGLVLVKEDGAPACPEDLREARQELDLWTGTVQSRFTLDGDPVFVKTACHPGQDAVAFEIRSPLLAKGRLKVFLASPGDDQRQMARYVGDWLHPAALALQRPGPRQARLARTMDGSEDLMDLHWEGRASLAFPKQEARPLRILKADYGAEGARKDVTSETAALVRDGALSLRPTAGLFGDPAPGRAKLFRLLYAAGPTAQWVCGDEHEELSIGAASERRRAILSSGPGEKSLSFVCRFTRQRNAAPPPSAREVFRASRLHWPQFWKSGGAIDLSQSSDPRWRELERRIVLSQYQMAVNSAGSLPSQESGLVNSGWHGRFHLEMTWWHEAHWALWGRPSPLKAVLSLYQRLLPPAKDRAKGQGFAGARWPKCIGPDGREWPHEIHALLLWQQPHPIFFAELDYRSHPSREVLLKWQPVVEATADFLSSLPEWNPERTRCSLAPPLFVASENTDPRTTLNPAFELAGWRFGLSTAQVWRQRLDLPLREDWQKTLDCLAPLPVQDGLYVLHEGVKDMWTRFNYEHPALLGALGMLPGLGVDRAVMSRTLDKVMDTWDFNRTWGWDCPLMAMTAARLGRPGLALDLLLSSSPAFQFDDKGLATGGPFPYFPANGGLLYAAALMARGWDGAPPGEAPGFPQNGRWKVRCEGLNPAP